MFNGKKNVNVPDKVYDPDRNHCALNFLRLTVNTYKYVYEI